MLCGSLCIVPLISCFKASMYSSSSPAFKGTGLNSVFGNRGVGPTLASGMLPLPMPRASMLKVKEATPRPLPAMAAGLSCTSTSACPGMSAADWYAHKSLGDGLFWIQERFYQSDNRANIWLLRGTHQDVVIDTGLGLRSLPDYIDSQGLLGKDPQRKNPLLAVATHAHFDHAGGLHQFQQVGVHSAEVDALANGDNYETVTWLSDREIAEAPSPGWRARQYRVKPVQPTHILQEGDVINLGNRQLTVLHMPGHSRGSICLHDRDNKLLFSGDVVYDGAMIDWLPYSRVSDYISSCERVVGLVDSEQVDQVLPGHYNTFGAKRLHRLASTYISRAGTCPAKFSTLAWRTVAGFALRASNPRCAC